MRLRFSYCCLQRFSMFELVPRLTLRLMMLQVRRLWASESQKLPVLEISLPKILECLGLTQAQFIDVCILAGCDYAESIKGALFCRTKPS